MGADITSMSAFTKLRGVMEPCDMYWGIKQS